MLSHLRNLLFPAHTPDVHCLNVGHGIVNQVGHDQINVTNVHNYYFRGGRSNSIERNNVVPYTFDVGTPNRGNTFVSKYSPFLWRPGPFDNLPIAIELIDILCVTLNPSDAHAISDLNAELKVLRRILKTVWLAVQRFTFFAFVPKP
jgi:hypothetical protein